MTSRLHAEVRGLALACVLGACAPAPPPIEPGDFAASLVGHWQGTVGGSKETLSFAADGTFVALLQPTGFISSTLSEGVAGTVRGTWSLEGNVIALRVTSAQNERLTNKTTAAAVETFHQNRLVVRSDKGVTSAFERLSP